LGLPRKKQVRATLPVSRRVALLVDWICCQSRRDDHRGRTRPDGSTAGDGGEWLSAWIEFAAPDFSPKTVKETRGYIARSLMPALGSRPLAEPKPADLDAFYRRLLTSGGSCGRPLAPGTGRHRARHDFEHQHHPSSGGTFGGRAATRSITYTVDP